MKSKIYRNKIVGYIVWRIKSDTGTIGTDPIIMNADGVSEVPSLAPDQEFLAAISANDDYQVWGMFKDEDIPLGFEFGAKSMKPDWNEEYKKKAKEFGENKKQKKNSPK